MKCLQHIPADVIWKKINFRYNKRQVDEDNKKPDSLSVTNLNFASSFGSEGEDDGGRRREKVLQGKDWSGSRVSRLPHRGIRVKFERGDAPVQVKWSRCVRKGAALMSPGEGDNDVWCSHSWSVQTLLNLHRTSGEHHPLQCVIWVPPGIQDRLVLKDL